MHQKIAEKFVKFKVLSTTRDDDVLDQLHHRILPIMLIGMCVFFSAKTKWGSIDCWIPKEFNDAHFQNYIHQYCWISNMYRVPMDEPLPRLDQDRYEYSRSIEFYRWVFLMFLVHAFMFKLPNLIWMATKTWSGIDIRKIVEMSITTQLKHNKHRDKNLRNIATFIDRWLKSYQKESTGRFSGFLSLFKGVFFCFGLRSGRFLTRLFIGIKLLYLFNILAQFQIVSTFLGFNFWTYGTNIARMLLGSKSWTDIRHFPRVGMCDFEIRQLQNIQRYTVQCSLPINMFLEKAYFILWFVFALLAVATTISLLQWSVVEVFSSRKDRFIRTYIHMLRRDGEFIDTQLFERFVSDYLRDDGLFLLRILKINAGHVHTLDLLIILWNGYKKENHKSDDLSETSPLKPENESEL